MTILAIDTATDLASVTLCRDGSILAEEVVITSDGHSYLIFDMISKVLASAGVVLTDIDCFAAARGPGSFTGVRICLTAAKGLAEALGKPVAGISNLRALATFGTAELRNPIIDARRGQIYTAVYNSKLELLSDEVVIAESQWTPPSEAERISRKEALAAAIAKCAELDGPGKWLDPAALDAHYIRQTDAQSFWTDLRSQLP